MQLIIFRKRCEMKRSLTLVTLLSFLTLQTLAQTFDFRKGNVTANEYLIELPYQNVNDKIIIEVVLKGKKRRFLLDTGAPLAISQELFEELKPTILTKKAIQDINQKSDSLLFVSIDSLQIGEVYAVDIPAIVLKNNLILDCLKLDGFLGSNVLRNSVLQFDSRNQVIRISNSSTNLDIKDLKGDEMLLDQQSSPFLKFKIGKKISEFVMFDSGSDVLYSMAHEKIKKFSKANEFVIIQRATGSNQIGLFGIADSEETFLLRIPAAQLSGARLNNIISETSNNNNSRLGSAILHYGILTLDYNKKKYYYQPYSENTTYQSEEFQISPTFIENKLCIGKIWAKELEQAVSVGDEIITINELRVDNMTICDAIAGAIPKSTSSAKVEVRRKDGTITSVIIEKIN